MLVQIITLLMKYQLSQSGQFSMYKLTGLWALINPTDKLKKFTSIKAEVYLSKCAVLFDPYADFWIRC